MAAGQKLELTWIGKDKEERVEPRILIYDKEKSYGDQNTGNMLIHGDNLLALKSLEQEYAGKVKCIYIEICSALDRSSLSSQEQMGWGSHKQLRIAC